VYKLKKGIIWLEASTKSMVWEIERLLTL
jgi:hypothetical protein